MSWPFFKTRGDVYNVKQTVSKQTVSSAERSFPYPTRTPCAPISPPRPSLAAPVWFVSVLATLGISHKWNQTSNRLSGFLFPRPALSPHFPPLRGALVVSVSHDPSVHPSTDGHLCAHWVMNTDMNPGVAHKSTKNGGCFQCRRDEERLSGSRRECDPRLAGGRGRPCTVASVQNAGRGAKGTPVLGVSEKPRAAGCAVLGGAPKRHTGGAGMHGGDCGARGEHRVWKMSGAGFGGIFLLVMRYANRSEQIHADFEPLGKSFKGLLNEGKFKCTRK